MRQRRDFDAHVLEYAALKIPALPFQAEKRVFCKFAQHLHIASAYAAASLRKVTSQPAFDDERRKAGKAEAAAEEEEKGKRKGISNEQARFGGGRGRKRQRGFALCSWAEPVSRIYANPTFAP